jgi:hypothetical protein
VDSEDDTCRTLKASSPTGNLYFIPANLRELRVE